MTINAEMITEVTRRLVAELNPEEIILFGSYAWGTPKTLTQVNSQALVDEDELEVSVDKLLDEFATSMGSNLPTLSDYAVSRESIYEDRP